VHSGALARTRVCLGLQERDDAVVVAAGGGVVQRRPARPRRGVDVEARYLLRGLPLQDVGRACLEMVLDVRLRARASGR
jgi:hypothetical protein